MTRVCCYSLLGWRRGDSEGTDDVRRTHLPEWNLAKAVRWALERGCDSILIELTGIDEVEPSPHLCGDPGCPGGCEWNGVPTHRRANR